MAKSSRVFNVTSRRYIKYSQTLGRIEQCVSVWVDEGRTIRDLSVAEMVAARSEQTRKREPLAFAELPGLHYRPAERDQASNRNEVQLMCEANRFAQSVIRSVMENQTA